MTTKRQIDPRNFCNYTYSDGRRCRMLQDPNWPNLCPFHAREEQHLLESHRLGTELSTTLTGDFLTASDVNHVLGKVFTALAQNRIPPRNAATLAYIGQLLLQSIPQVDREMKFEYDYDAWERMIDDAVPLSPPPRQVIAQFQPGRKDRNTTEPDGEPENEPKPTKPN